MKINLTKKEYRTLVEMIYLSDWVVSAHEIERDNIDKAHVELRKKLLSHYKEMQMEDMIEYSAQDDDYYETNDYDQYIHEKFIDKYNENIFWEELIDKLAVRDVINNIGMEKYLKLDMLERMHKIGNEKEKYGIEFEKHELNRVRIGKESIAKT